MPRRNSGTSHHRFSKTNSAQSSAVKESWKSIFVKGLVNNLAALLIAPVTLLIGIEIGKYFQLPHPVIKSVDLARVIENGPYVLDSTIDRHLHENRLFMSRLQGFMPNDNVSYINWLDGKEPIDKEYVYIISVKLSQLLAVLQAEKESLAYNVSELQKWKPGTPLPDLLPTGQVDISIIQEITALPSLPGQTNPIFDVPAKFRNALKSTEKELKICSELLSYIESVKETYNDMSKSHLTGSTEFNVGILNKGESDGVAYKTGSYLIFEHHRLQLVLDSFYVIKPHSFRTLTYEIDDASDSASKASWTAFAKDTSRHISYKMFFNIDEKMYSQDSTYSSN